MLNSNSCKVSILGLVTGCGEELPDQVRGRSHLSHSFPGSEPISRFYRHYDSPLGIYSLSEGVWPRAFELSWINLPFPSAPSDSSHSETGNKGRLEVISRTWVMKGSGAGDALLYDNFPSANFVSDQWHHSVSLPWRWSGRRRFGPPPRGLPCKRPPSSRTLDLFQLLLPTSWTKSWGSSRRTSQCPLSPGQASSNRCRGCIRLLSAS